MKKKTFFIGFILSIAVFAFLFTGVFLLKTPKAFAADIEYTDGELKQSYTLGETLVCPSAKINVDGTFVDVVGHVLYYPDGNAVSDDQYVLSNPGKYVLRFFADYNGKTVYADDEFTVKGGLFGVNSEMSSVYYGNSGEDKGNVEGLQVSLSAGDVFTYNKPINFNGKTKNDKIVSFYVIPAVKGVADVLDVKIRLTDATDETNFIEFATFAQSDDENEASGNALASALCTGENAKYVGLHYKDKEENADFIYEDAYYSVYKDVSFTTRYGYPSRAASLAACVGYGAEVDYSKATVQQQGNFNKPFSYSLDYAERKAYGYDHGTGDWSKSSNVIIDLDDSYFFENPWSGFTADYAYLSVYSDMYTGSTFSFVILNIFDEDLEATDFTFEGKPVIKIEYPDGEIPYAIKGQPYDVFDAKAYSGCDGTIDCKALVYLDYYSNSPRLCKITDGAFVPTDEKQSYSIVYSAVDSYGNSAESVVNIPVKASRQASFTLYGEDYNVFTGEKIILKQPIIDNPNGSYTVSATATIGNDVYPITVSEDGIYSLYTLKAGDYTVKYSFTDYNGPIDETYELTVAENPYSVFYGDPVLPVVFVNGVEYVFPKQYGKAFNDGEVSDLNATLKYSFDGGELIDYVYGTPIRITAENNVKLVYSLVGAKEDCVIEMPVTAVRHPSGALKMENYFYSTQFDGQSSGDRVTYSTTESFAKLSYVKPLLTTAFSFNFKLKADSFSGISFIFTDANDFTNVLKVVMTNEGSSKFLVNINGQKKEITFSGDNDHKLTYNSVVNMIMIDDYAFNVVGVKDYAEKKAYFDIEVNGNNGEFVIDVMSISKQRMNNDKTEYTPPQYYLNVNDGAKNIGDRIVISGLFVEDVLSFGTSGSIYVWGPDDNFCVTVDGITMDGVTDLTRVYEIEVDAYGAYLIYFECEDLGGSPNDGDLVINSYDTTLPVVEISDKDKYAAVYAGNTYKIALATARDGDGEAIDVLTIVTDTEGVSHLLDKNEFYFSRAGVYKVVYYAKDRFGNVGFATYEIVAL